MAQRLSNAKAKITGVRIHKPRADSSIASVSMDQYELIFPHLPGLLRLKTYIVALLRNISVEPRTVGRNHWAVPNFRYRWESFLSESQSEAAHRLCNGGSGVR